MKAHKITQKQIKIFKIIKNQQKYKKLRKSKKSTKKHIIKEKLWNLYKTYKNVHMSTNAPNHIRMDQIPSQSTGNHSYCKIHCAIHKIIATCACWSLPTLFDTKNNNNNQIVSKSSNFIDFWWATTQPIQWLYMTFWQPEIIVVWEFE